MGKKSAGRKAAARNAEDKKRDRATKRELKRERKARKKGKEYDDELKLFNAQVSVHGVRIRDVKGDGNCMFRSVAHLLAGDEHQHDVYRQKCVDHLIANRENFEPFVEDDESFDDYTSRMRRDAQWGGNMELIALAQLIDTHIVVHQYKAPRLVIENFMSVTATTNELHLSYHGGEHYAAVESADGSPIRLLVGGASDGGSGSGGTGVINGPSDDENLVMDSTLCRHLQHVREVIRECYGDVDAAIECLIGEANAGVDWDDLDDGHDDGGAEEAKGGDIDGSGGGAAGGDGSVLAAAAATPAEEAEEKPAAAGGSNRKQRPKKGGGSGGGGGGKKREPKMSNKARKALLAKEREEEEIANAGRKGGRGGGGGKKQGKKGKKGKKGGDAAAGGGGGGGGDDDGPVEIGSSSI